MNSEDDYESVKAPQHELNEWFSAECFHGYSVEEWQRGTRDSLSQLLRSAAQRSNEPLTTYNHDYLLERLISVPWAAIFEHHDHLVSSQENHSDSSVRRKASQLNFLLDLFRDPSVWPYACQLALLSALITGLESHCIQLSLRERRLSPSQNTTRHFILQCLQRMPSLRNRQSPSMLLPPTNISALSIVQLRMGLVKEWMLAFPDWKKYMVPCVLDMLNVLDLIDHQDEVNSTSNKSIRFTQKRNKRIWQRVRGSLKSIDHLYGDEDVEEHRTQAQSYDISANKLFASTVETMDSTLRKEECKSRQVLRSKCVEFLWTMYDSGCSRRFVTQILNRFVKYPHKGAASICWFTVKFVHKVSSADSINFTQLARLVWSRHYLDESKSSIYALYFEMLADCSYFDNLENLWAGLAPFVEFVEEQIMTESLIGIDMEHQSQISGLCHPENNFRKRQKIQLILHLFGALLVQRGAILKHREKQFRALCVQLSSLYDDEQLWLEHYCMERDQAMIKKALSNAGIFASIDSCDGSLATGQSWNKPSRITCGMRLCEPDEFSTDLLSQISRRNGIPDYLQEKTKPLPPQPFSMNLDTEIKILSFLSYQKLVEVRMVCRAWRDAADDPTLWRNLYQKHFDLRNDDKRARNESLPWKSLFEDMIYAEGLRRALPGDKPQSHQICPFVGCTKILSTRVLQSHCYSHVNAEKRPSITNIKRKSERKSRTATKQRKVSPRSGSKRKTKTSIVRGRAESPKKRKVQASSENEKLKDQLLSMLAEHRSSFMKLLVQSSDQNQATELLRKGNSLRIEQLYSTYSKVSDREKIRNALLQVEQSTK